MDYSQPLGSLLEGSGQHLLYKGKVNKKSQPEQTRPLPEHCVPSDGHRAERQGRECQAFVTVRDREVCILGVTPTG